MKILNVVDRTTNINKVKQKATIKSAASVANENKCFFYQFLHSSPFPSFCYAIHLFLVAIPCWTIFMIICSMFLFYLPFQMSSIRM